VARVEDIARIGPVLGSELHLSAPPPVEADHHHDRDRELVDETTALEHLQREVSLLEVFPHASPKRCVASEVLD